MKWVFGLLLASLSFGALLAWSWAAWPIRPGWIGAALMVAAAFLARRHWGQQHAGTGEDPGARERLAWHSLAGVGVVCGHMIASILLGTDLHVGQGNTLAIDNWTLIAGSVIAWLLMRPRAMESDERDQKMADRGAHVSLRAMTGLLVALLLLLGFAPPFILSRLQPFVLANILVVIILLAALARSSAQLVGYRTLPGADSTDG